MIDSHESKHFRWPTQNKFKILNSSAWSLVILDANDNLDKKFDIFFYHRNIAANRIAPRRTHLIRLSCLKKWSNHHRHEKQKSRGGVLTSYWKIWKHKMLNNIFVQSDYLLLEKITKMVPTLSHQYGALYNFLNLDWEHDAHGFLGY